MRNSPTRKETFTIGSPARIFGLANYDVVPRENVALTLSMRNLAYIVHNFARREDVMLFEFHYVECAEDVRLEELLTECRAANGSNNWN